MPKDINLTSQQWNDIVFEGRAKDYGAYEMRQTSSRRHIIAFFAIILVAVFVAFLPQLVETVAKFGQRAENISDDTTLADLAQMEEMEKLEELVKEQLVEPPPPLKSTIQFVAPEIVADEEIADEDLLKSQDELQDSKAQVSLFDVKGDDDVLGVDKAELEAHQRAAEDVGKVFDFVEQMPQFPGGAAEMMKFIHSNIVYPSMAQENNIQGTVSVRFTVMNDGSIANVTVLRSPDSVLSDEAVRVIKSMPKWIPGKQNGQPVNVNFNVPVRFVLQSN